MGTWLRKHESSKLHNSKVNSKPSKQWFLTDLRMQVCVCNRAVGAMGGKKASGIKVLPSWIGGKLPTVAELRYISVNSQSDSTRFEGKAGNRKS